MCIGGPPKAPAPPAALPEAPQTPTPAAGAATGDEDARRRRAAAGAGTTGTILTGARGIQDDAAAGAKTLLGA